MGGEFCPISRSDGRNELKFFVEVVLLVLSNHPQIIHILGMLFNAKLLKNAVINKAAPAISM